MRLLYKKPGCLLLATVPGSPQAATTAGLFLLLTRFSALGARCLYLPRKDGSVFSRNALVPSRKSSVEATNPK
jgi:hypothetical protein